jgi:hypothetical protein
MKLPFKTKRYIFILFASITTHSMAMQEMVIPKDGKAGDLFGFSVAIDGTTALIGANKVDAHGTPDAGAAYVYVLNKNGWTKQAKLIAKPAFADDSLAGNVALKNDIAMLGVMRRDDKGEDSGAVVSFIREKNIWKQGQIITAPDANPGDSFGQSTALTSKYLVVGAPRNDASGKDSGAAYIYKRTNDIWHFHTRLTASDGEAGDLFGISVAIDQDTILVGADLHDETAEDAGAVYVYKLHGSDWKEEAKLLASDGGKTDIFGVRVAISGNTALISARRDDIDEIGVNAGSAYVYVRDGSNWTQQHKLISPDGEADDRFGRGVAIKDNTAIVSAMNHDANGENTGAMYVYKNGANGWEYASKIVAKMSMPDDRFGWNVSLSNNIAIMSAPHHDAIGEDSGAIFIQGLCCSIE